jgi:ABC-type dipeptide/oligopeptide/nickel transport system permease component
MSEISVAVTERVDPDPSARLWARPWSRPWVRFGVRRAGRLLVSVWVLVTASFAMIHLIPGDPVRGALGPTAPAALVEARRHALGLDAPLLTQYWHFLKGLCTGDLGTSLSAQLPVTDVVAQRLPTTLTLPVISLAIGPSAILARIVRVEMVRVLEADFMRTARAKRLPARTVYLGHALPNAVTAALTLGGLILGAMVAGTVLVENVFALPGLGRTVVQSILTKDYPVVQAIVLIYGIGVLLINTAVDITLAVLDPRSMIREA